MQKLIDEFTSLAYPLDAMLTSVLPLFRVESFQRATSLLVPGQVQRRLYIVRSGYGRVYYKQKVKPRNSDKPSKPEAMNRRFVGEGGWLSVPGSFVLQDVSSDYIEICKNSDVYYLDYEDYVRLCSTDGDFARAAQRIWAKQVQLADAREDLLRLSNPVSQRVEKVFDTYPGIQDYVAQKDIANYAMVSPSTVSRYKAYNS